MAYPSFDFSQSGSVNQSGAIADVLTRRELFPTRFNAEVIRAFEMANIFLAFTMQKGIDKGKSDEFPVMGTTTARTFIPDGSGMTGQLIKQAKRNVLVDEMVVSDVSVTNINELMEHWASRANYVQELGEALSGEADSRASRAIVRAARTPSVISGTEELRNWGGSSGVCADTGGATTSNSNRATGINTDFNIAAATAIDIGVLLTKLWKAHEWLDRKNIPREGRQIALSPVEYYLVFNNTTLLSTPLNTDLGGGVGSYAEGTFQRIGSAKVHMTNNMPFGTEAASTGNNGLKYTKALTGGNSYNGDFSGTKALVWHPSAVGTLNMLEPTTEFEPSVSRQGTLIVSKYVKGHAPVRPEAAVEIYKGTALTTQAKILPEANN